MSLSLCSGVGRRAPDEASLVHATVPIHDFRPATGRHRATEATRNRTARALAAGAVGVFVAAVLGWVMAGALGLTGSASTSGPARLALPSAAHQADRSAPTSRPTVDPSAAPARETDSAPSAVSTVAPPPTRSDTLASAPRPTVEPAREAVPIVHPGEACPAEGDTGMTKSGKATVCTASAGSGQPRWQRA
jgi:hypothetical protein